ncbi:MAG: DUF507 family protein [Deltaproteobacteria bacterium]|nr:DUF507 family protein [Deltaproteobacteria bacterium]
MKIREEQLHHICRTILSRWRVKGMIRPKAADDVLLAKMIGAVTKDFQREEALDREVEALLEKHSRDLAQSQASAHLMFQKIKERLAKERGIVL